LDLALALRDAQVQSTPLKDVMRGPEGQPRYITSNIMEPAIWAAQDEAHATRQLLLKEIARLRSDLTARETSPAAPQATGSKPQSHAAPPGEASIFRHDGATWFAEYQNVGKNLPDSVGMQYIAMLLAHPNQKFTATDLVDSRPRRPAAHGDLKSIDDGTLSIGEGSSSLGHAEGALDEAARRDLREEYKSLREDCDEATQANDFERARRLQCKLDQLTQGFGEARRAFSSPRKKASDSVRRAISRALKVLEAEHPALGQHFETALDYGTECMYHPAPPVAWQL
jgi:hypothetical protein